MLWVFAVVILKLSGTCRVLFLLAGKGHSFPGREGELCFPTQPFAPSLPCHLGAWLPELARSPLRRRGAEGTQEDEMEALTDHPTNKIRTRRQKIVG